MNYAEARSKWDDMSDAVREVVACGGVIAAAFAEVDRLWAWLERIRDGSILRHGSPEGAVHRCRHCGATATTDRRLIHLADCPHHLADEALAGDAP